MTVVGIVKPMSPKTTLPEDSPLDPGIEGYVQIPVDNGIQTYESCQGGEGHSAPEPFVRFHGERATGMKALAVALEHHLPVDQLRRFWRVVDGEVEGPGWEITFTKPDLAYEGLLQRARARAEGREL